jgi:hypothetical protein
VLNAEDAAAGDRHATRTWRSGATACSRWPTAGRCTPGGQSPARTRQDRSSRVLPRWSSVLISTRRLAPRFAVPDGGEWRPPGPPRWGSGAGRPAFSRSATRRCARHRRQRGVALAERGRSRRYPPTSPAPARDRAARGYRQGRILRADRHRLRGSAPPARAAGPAAQ